MKRISELFNIKRINPIIAIAAMVILLSSSTLVIIGTVEVEYIGSETSYMVKKDSVSLTLDSNSRVNILNSDGNTLVINSQGRTVTSSNDPSTAIQWAIDHSSPGKSVLINAGRYDLSKVITLNSKVTLTGEGDKTILENGELNVGHSNVAIKSLRMEGTCHIVITSNKEKISNVVIENVSASTGVTQAVFSVVANSYDISNIKFIRNSVTNSSAYGFQLLGNALISDVLFDSCKAVGLGLDDRPDDRVVGFDLANTDVRDITVLHSESSNNWENGFRASIANSITPVSKTNVILQDCIANNNGQKPGSAEGFGYLIDSDVKMINSTGFGNFGGLTNLLSIPLPQSKEETYIEISMPSSSIQIGRNMHAVGDLIGTNFATPLYIQGATVQLSIILPDGTIAYPSQGQEAITDAFGRFAIDYVPSTIGIYQYKAEYNGNASYNATSTVVAFSAVNIQPQKAHSSISLILANSSVQTGNKMHAEGLLKGVIPLPSATINLQVTLPNGTYTSPTQGMTVITDSAGKFAMDYVPIAEGAHTYAAIFLGNDQNFGASVNTSFFAVLQSQPLPAPVLTASISADPISLYSTETSEITVHVTEGANSVEGASVFLSSDNGGTFSSLNNLGSGMYSSMFTAPIVASQIYCHIVADISKLGYNSDTVGTDIVVAPVPPVPSAPTLVSATPDHGKVVLTWTGPSDDIAAITGYEIYRGTTSDGETLLTTLGNVLTYTDASLTNGKTYYYKVSAVNSVGAGALSNELSAIPIAPPTAPQNLQASPGDGLVNLTWQAPSDNGGSPVINYQVWRGPSSGAETFFANNSLKLWFNDAGLVNGQMYYYKVRAENAHGQGPDSVEVSATPSQTVTVASAPRELSATADDAQITLTWSTPASDGGATISNIKVYRGGSSGGETFLTMLGNVLTYIDGTVSIGAIYYYKVSAVNLIGEGPQSNEASATPAIVPSAPTLSPAIASNTQVTLIWTAPGSDGGNAITNYLVYRGTTSGGETLLATLGNVLTYTNTGLTNGQIYYYKVSAMNSVGEGALSDESSAVPITVSSATLSLVATPGNGQISLTWYAPSSDGGAAITNYNVYRGTSSGGETHLTTIGNVLTLTDTSVTNGVTYFYMVSATNSAGEGVLSSESSATPVTTPTAPTIVSATSGNALVTLVWTAPSSNGGSSITGYKVYRGTTSGGETLLTTLGNVLTYTDASLTNGKTYYYKVSAVNSVGTGALSNERSATPTIGPTYDYLVSSSSVKNPSGVVVYTGSNMSAALNWAVSHSNTVTYVPAGTYVLPYRVTGFASGVTLFGDGQDKTIFNFVWDHTGRGADQYAAKWFFGFQPTNVNNIVLKQFGITGDGSICFDTTTGKTSNNLVQDVTISNTSDIQLTSFGSWVSSGAIADGYKFIRCIAYNTGGDGFDIWGRGGYVSGGMHTNVYFEDCKALWCGYSSRYWDWTCGWDIGEEGRVTNVKLVRCEASNNWESGFHFEASGSYPNFSVMNAVLDNCVANYNGKKFSDPRGPMYGYGCHAGIYPTYINFVAIGNPGLDNGGVRGWRSLYNVQSEAYTYQVGKYDAAQNIVYRLDGTTAYTGSSFTVALQWAVGHTNAVVKLPRSPLADTCTVNPFIVTAPIQLASGVTLYGNGPGGNWPAAYTALKFSNPADGLVVKNSNTRIIDLVIIGGGIEYRAIGGATISKSEAKGLIIQQTASGHPAAVYSYCESGSTIDGLDLGAIQVTGAYTDGFRFSGAGFATNCWVKNLKMTMCIASSCGISSPRQNDYCNGFRLGEGVNVQTATIFGCEASSNWCSGFYFASGGQMNSVSLQNCLSSLNGKKGDANNGMGYQLNGQSVSLINCKGNGNYGVLVSL
jgi:fibronectin type 3 domain-containing protein